MTLVLLHGLFGGMRKALGVLVLSLLLPGVLFAKEFDALVKEGRAQLSQVETEPDRGNTHVPAGMRRVSRRSAC